MILMKGSFHNLVISSLKQRWLKFHLLYPPTPRPSAARPSGALWGFRSFPPSGFPPGSAGPPSLPHTLTGSLLSLMVTCSCPGHAKVTLSWHHWVIILLRFISLSDSHKVRSFLSLFCVDRMSIPIRCGERITGHPPSSVVAGGLRWIVARRNPSIPNWKVGEPLQRRCLANCPAYL